MMKQKVRTFFGGLLFLAVLCTLGGIENYVKTSYTIEATIVGCEDSVYKAEDSTGDSWEIDEGSYMIGNKVKLYMNTNNTDSNFSDDEIRKVKIIKGD